jgi:hypothetical protein
MQNNVVNHDIKSVESSINNYIKAIYNACLWNGNPDREYIKGDLAVFDKKAIEGYREYIETILNSMRCIPQGKNALNNSIIELGLASGELHCDTMPSSWNVEGTYVKPSYIVRPEKEAGITELSIGSK